ncbi:hypothetical protein BDZ91DRAFT_368505 [Kalaharituber pfeilii]|nr:hypothetical protein BDZ91DRAFT_368505 [Kalaharituber pfeilii]
MDDSEDIAYEVGPFALNQVLVLMMQEDQNLNFTGTHELPPSPAPTVEEDLQVLPSISMYTQQIIRTERRRRRMVHALVSNIELQQSVSTSGTAANAADVHQYIRQTPLHSHPAITPKERFCLPNLVEDADAVYGRVQWGGNSKDPIFSVEGRQRHAWKLALRFHHNPQLNSQHPSSSHEDRTLSTNQGQHSPNSNEDRKQLPPENESLETGEPLIEDSLSWVNQGQYEGDPGTFKPSVEGAETGGFLPQD